MPPSSPMPLYRRAARAARAGLALAVLAVVPATAATLQVQVQDGQGKPLSDAVVFLETRDGRLPVRPLQGVEMVLLGYNTPYHNPPAPELPEDVVAQTQAKYREAYERITGREL